MNRLIVISVIIFSVVVLSFPLIGQDWVMSPIWKGKMVYNESVLFIEKGDKSPSARLLFKPNKIVRVQNSSLTEKYIRGVDWDYKGSEIYLLKGGRGVSMKSSDLEPSTGRFKSQEGKYVLHAEGDFFHKHQLAVTYKVKRKKWQGPVPIFEKTLLSKTISSLKNKKKIKILLYGDSIAAGANASGMANSAPFIPSWGDLVVNYLKEYYQTEIEFVNTSVGGMDSNWGRDNVNNLVIKHKPDLVIVAFGMNDGTGKMQAERFQDNIREIVEKTHEDNPLTEFILVGSMLANPNSFFVGTQDQFIPKLNELKGDGVTFVDISRVHSYLLQNKSYQDLTGNNINHPNDFLIRCYAQYIAGALVEFYK